MEFGSIGTAESALFAAIVVVLVAGLAVLFSRPRPRTDWPQCHSGGGEFARSVAARDIQRFAEATPYGRAERAEGYQARPLAAAGPVRCAGVPPGRPRVPGEEPPRE